MPQPSESVPHNFIGCLCGNTEADSLKGLKAISVRPITSMRSLLIDHITSSSTDTSRQGKGIHVARDRPTTVHHTLNVRAAGQRYPSSAGPSGPIAPALRALHREPYLSQHLAMHVPSVQTPRKTPPASFTPLNREARSSSPLYMTP